MLTVNVAGFTLWLASLRILKVPQGTRTLQGWSEIWGTVTVTVSVTVRVTVVGKYCVIVGGG